MYNSRFKALSGLNPEAVSVSKEVGLKVAISIYRNSKALRPPWLGTR